MDKTASLSITVHDSDDSIGANPDLHNRVFSKSARALQSSHEAIDGLSLPFFQLGGHPNQLQVGLHGGTSVGAVTQPAVGVSEPPSLGDVARGPLSIQNGGVSDDPMNPSRDSDSEKEIEQQQSAVNALQMIHHAIPSRSQQIAEAKAKAKASAKQPAQPKAVSGRKRKGGAAEEEKENTLKILRLDNSDGTTARSASNAKRSANGADAKATSDADDKVLADHNEVMTEQKKKAFATLKDTDPALNEFLKSSHKELGAVINKFKVKIKSLKRRADKNKVQYLCDGLQDMTDEMHIAHQALGALLNTSADPDIITNLKQLQHWNVSNAVFRRGFKCLTLSFVKYGDWPAFTASRQTMQLQMGFKHGEMHFELLTSEILQRLLKALPTKVSGLNFSKRLY